MRFLRATCGIALGGATGLFGAGALVNLLWKDRPFEQSPGAVFGGSFLAAIACCVCFGFKQNFIAWILFGASIGLLLLSFLMCLAAGMRHA